MVDFLITAKVKYPKKIVRMISLITIFLIAISIVSISNNLSDAAGLAAKASSGTKATVEAIIIRAGNSEDEKTRYQMLHNLLNWNDLNSA